MFLHIKRELSLPVVVVVNEPLLKDLVQKFPSDLIPKRKDLLTAYFAIHPRRLYELSKHSYILT